MVMPSQQRWPRHLGKRKRHRQCRAEAGIDDNTAPSPPP
jgi:hypothetical protein